MGNAALNNSANNHFLFIVHPMNLCVTETTICVVVADSKTGAGIKKIDCLHLHCLQRGPKIRTIFIVVLGDQSGTQYSLIKLCRRP